MRTVKVNTSKEYDVLIGSGLFEDAGTYIRQTVDSEVAAIVTDDIVDALYADRLERSLTENGFKVVKFVFPNGEQSKNAANYISILNFLAKSKLTRTDVVIALGGGVVGDLAGFASATYLRGIPFIQIPTTLLAAVDSSVGGKAAIDLDDGKNLAGAFYQPKLVICDCETLFTLQPEVFRDGCAEVIKYGIIADNAFFIRLLDIPIEKQLEDVIVKCVEIKRDIVCSDEFDNGVRQLLNFGHTIGHSIEASSNFTISHGSAIAIGMAIITRASVKKEICGTECLYYVLKILEKNYLPIKTNFDCDTLYQNALSDKKRRGDSINVVVPKSIGQCALHNIPTCELAEFIKLGTANGGLE